mgnify:CR=1 FL=1
MRGSWRYNAPAWRQLLLGLLAALLLGASAQAQELRAHNFRIEGGEVVLSDGVYLLNARIDFRLSEAAEDALDNGVPLTFVLQLEVERNRGWWWFDANVLSRNLRYRVRYHALSTRYLVTNVESGETRSFTSKQAALAALRWNGPGVRAYDLPGGETLSYREMVARVLAALRPPRRLWVLPGPLFALAAWTARGLRLHDAGPAVLARMRQDLVFDAGPARRDLGYAPRGFAPEPGMFGP